MILVAESEESVADVAAALRGLGVAVDVHTIADDLVAGARSLAARPATDVLIVCDCAGERGYERAFFVCRELGKGAVVLLACDDEVEPEAVDTLAAGVRKTVPELRLAVVSNRVDEAMRPSGGGRRSHPSSQRIAELLRRVAADPDAWSTAAQFSL